jgi:hypothetical protein
MVRDLAVSAGIAMNIEDTWGGDIVTAAIAALAHSTPPDFLFCRYRTWNIAGYLESCFSYCFCATSLCFPASDGCIRVFSRFLHRTVK